MPLNPLVAHALLRASAFFRRLEDVHPSVNAARKRACVTSRMEMQHG